MVKFFTTKEWLPPACHPVDLLEPFWGPLQPFGVAQGMDRNEKYKHIARELFFLTAEKESADYFLLPSDYKFYAKHPKLLAEIEQLSRKTGKAIITFIHADRYQRVLFSNAIVFRTSGYRSLNVHGRDYSMPFSFGDLLAYYGNGLLQFRKKNDKPVVGFCGNVSGNYLKAIAKRVLRGRRNGFDYTSLRTEALRVFAGNTAVATNFILRTSHFAGAAHGSGINEVRKVFFDNLMNSDYPLAMRGEGNYSYRFYEIMQSGRIPLLIDTDCDFPFDDQVNLRSLIPVISHNELSSAPEYLRDFHHALRADDFINRQKLMREAWETWYENSGFFTKLHNLLIARL